jgi:methylated-DNA-protein-cysteine methyltransferase-like protein
MSFFDEVYELVKRISVGKVTTYGEIARALGTQDARRVGHALHANTDKDCPCHRVVNKDGRLAPNFAIDGPEEQRRRLEQEGVEFVDEMHVDLNKHLWVFE